MASGIYRIVNTIDGKSYVGQAQDLHKRFRSHRSYLQNGKHRNKHLLSAWRKYGPDAFLFEVVQHVDDASMLDAYEAAWFFITLCCDRRYGYNISIDPTSPNRGLKFGKYPRERVEAAAAPRRGKPLTAECRANMSLSQKRRREREAAMRAA